ncbi:MAG: ABC transporter substrate-binding protein [Nitrospirae bacterium YQR-1]
MFTGLIAKRKTLLYAFVILLLITTIAFILYKKRGVTKVIRTPKKVVIAYVNTLHSTLVQIAWKKGFFKDEALDITLMPHTHGKTALEAVLAGNADIATVAATPVMFNIVKGEKIYVLSSILNSGKVNVMIALKDKGISDVAGFSGKTIGITRGTTSEYFLYLFCLIHGIKYDGLKFIDKKPEEMLELLTGGQVDAVSTWQPFATLILKKLSNKVKVFDGEGIYSENFYFVAKQSFVHSDPEVIERVLSAMYKAEQYIKKEPEKSQEIIADSVRIDQALIKEIWDLYNFELNLDQYFVSSLETVTQWAIMEKKVSITNMPDYLEYVYHDGLKKINPYSITLIQ